MRPSRTTTRLGAAVASLALLTTACGGGGGGGTSSSADQIDFVLNFAAAGFHAGFAAAEVEGFYEDEGLDVEITEGQGSTTTSQLVASGQVDVAYADAAAVMPLIADGAPITVVATMSQVSPNQVTALKRTNLTSVSDLRGKSLGVPAGSSQIPMVPILLADAGLTEQDVDLVNLPGTSLVPSLIQGQVDAILGSTDAYGIQLEQQGAETDDYLFADNGVETVSVSIIARDDFLEANPETVRSFVDASLQGWEFTRENPEDGVADLVELFPSLSEEQAMVEYETTPELFCRDNPNLGKAEPEQWERATELLQSVDLLDPESEPTDFYSYDYLPDDLPEC